MIELFGRIQMHRLSQERGSILILVQLEQHDSGLGQQFGIGRAQPDCLQRAPERGRPASVEQGDSSVHRVQLGLIGWFHDVGPGIAGPALERVVVAGHGLGDLLEAGELVIKR